MKLSRRKLRQLIYEALSESGRKYMVEPSGETYNMDQLSRIKKTGRTLDAMSTGKHPNLDALKVSDPDYARVLAVDAGYQPPLNQIEIGAQSIPDSDFTKSDTQFQDYSISRSIEIIKHLKRECQQRHYKCTIKDERAFDPDDPFIALHIDGTGYNPNINFSVHFGCSDTLDLEECGDLVIDIYDVLQRDVFEPYDYYSMIPSLRQPKNVALQILDIIEKASNFEFNPNSLDFDIFSSGFED